MKFLEVILGFNKKELYSLDSFPWIRDVDQRLELLNENNKKIEH